MTRVWGAKRLGSKIEAKRLGGKRLGGKRLGGGNVLLTWVGHRDLIVTSFSYFYINLY